MNLSLRKIFSTSMVVLGLSALSTSAFALQCNTLTFNGSNAVNCVAGTGQLADEDFRVNGDFPNLGDPALLGGNWIKLVSGGDGGSPGPTNFGDLRWTLTDPLSGNTTSGGIGLSIADDSNPGNSNRFELMFALGAQGSNDAGSTVEEYVAYLVSDAASNPQGLAFTIGSNYTGSWNLGTVSNIVNLGLSTFTVYARIVEPSTSPQLPEPGSLMLLGAASLAAVGLRRRKIA